MKVISVAAKNKQKLQEALDFAAKSAARGAIGAAGADLYHTVKKHLENNKVDHSTHDKPSDVPAGHSHFDGR